MCLEKKQSRLSVTDAAVQVLMASPMEGEGGRGRKGRESKDEE